MSHAILLVVCAVAAAIWLVILSATDFNSLALGVGLLGALAITGNQR